MKKNKVFEFPQDSQIKIPERYNEEWLKTASLEDKCKFLNEFMNGFNDAYERPKLYVKDDENETQETKEVQDPWRH